MDICSNVGLCIKGFTIYLFLTSSSLYAQNSFVKYFGGAGNEQKTRMTDCPDGGYLLSSTTTSFGAGQNDYLLVKVNSEGQLQWSKTIGTTTSESFSYPAFIKRVPTGGYILSGSTQGNLPIMYLIRLNEQGDTLWTRVYEQLSGGGGSVAPIVATSDGGFVLTGSFAAGGLGIIKLNSEGDTLWTRFIGPNQQGRMGPFSVIELSGGGFAICGSGSLTSSGFTDVLLMRLNDSGQPLWGKFFGTSREDQGFVLKETSDGGLIVGGTFNSSGLKTNSLVIKTDHNGNIEWSKYYSNSLYRDMINSMITSINGYLFLAGSFTSASGSSESVIFKTDTMGNVLFARKYGYTSSTGVEGDLFLHQDSSLVFSSSGIIGIGLSNNAILYKTDGLGNSCISDSIALSGIPIVLSTENIPFAVRSNYLVRRSRTTLLSAGGLQYDECNTTGISNIEMKGLSKILPNPCSNCHLETSEESFNWNCTDIFGRNIPVHFKKSETGFLLEFDKKDKPEILYLRHFATGRVIRFIKE